MSISQLSVPHTSVFSRINNALFILTLFISASATFAATHVVPAGGDLQAAIKAAESGDTIILAAGATYRGPFTLPKKTGDAYITIQSSRADEITGRVSPSQSDLLARIRSNVKGDPIIDTAKGAHHYQLIGLEISTFSSTDFIYDLIRLGEGRQKDLSDVPHHLILDRLWIHGFATQSVQRGISLNSAETSIINSHISDIHDVGFDTQAICGWNGPGPFQIINNYLEAAGENVMFGGALASIPDLIPSNIEIRRNHFFKPLSWKVGDPSYAGFHWTIKNLLEFKNAKDVVIDSNVFENCWSDAQTGYAVLFTVRGEGANEMPQATVQNVTFSNNLVKNSEQGILTLGLDNMNASTRGSGLHVFNNQFVGIKNWFFLLNGFYNTTIEHNTHEQGGNIIVLTGHQSLNFVYRNNATIRNPNGFGVFGDGTGEGVVGLNQYSPGGVFEGNVIAGASAGLYPAGNFFPADLSNLKSFVSTDGLTPGYLGSATNPTPLPTPAPTPVSSASPTPTPTPSPAPTPNDGIQLSAASYSVNEDAESVTITVNRSGNTSVTASVHYATADVSASSPGDYNVVSGTLNFAPGESSRSFMVPVIDDLNKESNETFNVILSNVSNANLGNPDIATVSIVDNDRRSRGPRVDGPRGEVPRVVKSRKARLVIDQ